MSIWNQLLQRISGFSQIGPESFGRAIASEKQNILATFLSRVRAEVPAAHDHKDTYLADHIPDLIDEVAEFLLQRGRRKNTQDFEKFAAVHGLFRAQSGKYTLLNIRHEYLILRETIVSVIPPSAAISKEALNLFSQAIEISLSRSVEIFLRNSISDMRSASESFQQSENQQMWIREALNRLPKPLFLLDLDAKKVSYSNQAAKRMLGIEYAGYTAADVVGSVLIAKRPNGELIKIEDMPSSRVLRGEAVNGEEVILTTPVGEFHIKVFSEHLPAIHGQPESALILFQDITELKKVESQLLETQKDLNKAVEIAQVGFWNLDLKTQNISVTDHLLTQFGIDKDTFNSTLEETISVIHPEDRERVSTAINAAIRTRVPYNIQYRVVHSNGSVHWIEARGEGVYDSLGEPIRFNGTTMDITKTTQARIMAENSMIDLQEARLVADRANAAKSQFLANMSHEIRTPLGAIMGFASLLKDDGLKKEERDSFSSVIERNSSQLLRIIDDILDLSKVEAGMMLIEHIEFSLPEMLTDFSSLMGFKAREKGIGFASKAVTTLPSLVTTDPTRLRQILINVVGNAIKFTERGHVEMCVAYKDGFLEFEIEDTGRGISPEQEQNLFQPFSQADSSITRKFGGTGLGLVLSRSLSEALGGSFDLKRSVLGQGSTFVVRIAVTMKPNVNYVNVLGFETVPARTIANAGQLSGMKILVVEDSPDNQALISIYLGRVGANIDIASDGEQGYQMAIDGHHDLVLMDVQMPIMDGITTIKKLRASGFRRPVVALTAHAMKEERKRCLDAGFTDFLSKPINKNELIGLILQYKNKLR
mgnify:CR=1 FL=1|tara:strand:+ start:14898 stop:17360 length:2463 start_codon:yes stop_codon:yes gene_type:complete